MGRLLNSCKEQQQIIISWFSLSPYNNTVHRARHSSRQQGDKFILGSTYPPIGDNSPAFKNFILPKQTGLTCGGSSTGPSPSVLIVMQWVNLSLKCKCNGKFNLKDYATNCNLQVAKHGEIVRLKSEEQGEGVPLWTERWRWIPDQFNIELSALQYFGIHGNQDLHQQKLGDGMFTGNCCEDGDENIMMKIGAGASDEYLNRFNNYTAQNWNINSNRKKAPVIWLVDILSPLNAVAPRFSVSSNLSPLSGILGTKSFPPLANWKWTILRPKNKGSKASLIFFVFWSHHRPPR